ncbi:hypothetical protein ACFL6U_12425 [Planctomycetota bacterium]
MHDVDLTLRKEGLRFIIEEYEPDVFGIDRFIRTVHEIHASAELDKVHGSGLIKEGALDLFEVSTNETQVQIVQSGALVEAVIKGDRGRQSHEFGFHDLINLTSIRGISLAG